MIQYTCPKTERSLFFVFERQRKVRTVERRVPLEKGGTISQGIVTVRATETNRGHARVKRAILPTATGELHHNGRAPFLGDNDTGLEK